MLENFVTIETTDMTLSSNPENTIERGYHTKNEVLKRTENTEAKHLLPIRKKKLQFFFVKGCVTGNKIRDTVKKDNRSNSEVT